MSDKMKVLVVILIFLFSLLAFKVAINEIWISYFSSKLVTYSMGEIEKNSIGFNRYIQINDAVLDGSYIFQYEASRFADESSPNSNVRYILLPLYGEKDIPLLMNNEKPIVSVLLKYHMGGGTSNNNIDEWVAKNHPPSGKKFSISGVTNMELDSITSEARNKFESFDTKLVPNQ